MKLCIYISVKLPWEGAFYTYIEQSVNQCDRIYKPVCECTKDGKNCIKTGTSSDEILLISFSPYPFLLTSTSSSSAILQFFTSRSHSYRVQISLWATLHCHNNITIKSSYIRRGKAKRDELVYLKNNKKKPGRLCMHIVFCAIAPSVCFCVSREKSMNVYQHSRISSNALEIIWKKN